MKEALTEQIISQGLLDEERLEECVRLEEESGQKLVWTLTLRFESHLTTHGRGPQISLRKRPYMKWGML